MALCIVFKEAFAPYFADDDSSVAKAQQVVVVGGGYIGMEVSAADVAWNLDATPLLRLFTPSLARKYEELYHVNGVKLLKGTSVNGLVCGDDGKVVAVWHKEKVATLEHEDGIK
ncbi:monodehydroascorbate reductase 6, partial [Tanacetum coccineum]